MAATVPRYTKAVFNVLEEGASAASCRAWLPNSCPHAGSDLKEEGGHHDVEQAGYRIHTIGRLDRKQQEPFKTATVGRGFIILHQTRS